LGVFHLSGYPDISVIQLSLACRHSHFLVGVHVLNYQLDA